MLIVTATYIRPNTSVSFSPPDQSFVDNREANYIQTGKIISRVVSESNDSLTRTVVTTWKTRADLEAFRADPVTVEFNAIRREYFSENQISSAREFEFIATDDDPGPGGF